VSRLNETLYNKKGKAKQTQPHLDNTTMGMKKLDEKEIGVCWLCQKEDQKSANTRLKKEKTNKQAL
jgi:hypothetical protein